MTTKRIFYLIGVVAILFAVFASPASVLALSGCASAITVQWGDTLSGIAVTCGTTVEAIRAVNPGLGWWLYAGQLLYIPNGTIYNPSGTPYYPSNGSVYVVQWGDTLGTIAAGKGLSVNNILAVNPQIWNPSLIFPGQVINLPAWTAVPPPPYVPAPVYIPPPPYVSPPANYSQTSTFKVSYKKGLLVRSGPGKEYAEIRSPYVSADNKSVWQYKSNTLTLDAKGLLWAEVILSPLVQGYSTGWIMVKDSLGNYFTEPNIDP